MEVIRQFAAECGGVETNVVNCDAPNGIYGILLIVLNVLTVGVLVVAVLGLILAGVQYLTARDNEAQMVAAKKRIGQIVLGIVIYAVAWTVMEWLIPGGIINDAIQKDFETPGALIFQNGMMKDGK